MLTLILGPSGSGKSVELLQALKARAEAGGAKDQSEHGGGPFVGVGRPALPPVLGGGRAVSLGRRRTVPARGTAAGGRCHYKEKHKSQTARRVPDGNGKGAALGKPSSAGRDRRGRTGCIPRLAQRVLALEAVSEVPPLSYHIPPPIPTPAGQPNFERGRGLFLNMDGWMPFCYT